VTRQIQDIAYEISYIWYRDYEARGPVPNFYNDAKPYLQAMFYLVSVNDNYKLDSGRDIVQRFLCNVRGWRGPDARRIKHELRELLK
jgi:hypothetical protein